MIAAGPSGLASGEIAERLAIAPTRMSFHLAVLERSGLAHTWRAGRNVLYAVRFEARDLWPDGGATESTPGHAVVVDLFEPYLEPT